MKLLYRLEKACGFAGKWLTRAALFLRHLRVGIELEYPICCILHFAWDASDAQLKGRGLTHGPAVKRGGIFAGLREDGVTKKIYVPCAYHKGRHPGWEPWQLRPSQLRLFPDEIGRS